MKTHVFTELETSLIHMAYVSVDIVLMLGLTNEVLKLVM